MHRIDPATLETLGKTDLSSYVSVHTATAHHHQDPSSGDIWNIGTKFGRVAAHVLVKTPTNSDRTSTPIDGTVMVGEVTTDTDNPAYVHSFGMTENYVLIVEAPLRMNSWELMKMNWSGKSVAECMRWHKNCPTTVRVVERGSGKEVAGVK